MFPIFSCSINVTVTSPNDVPSFYMNHLVYTCKCCIHLNSLHFSVVYCVEVVENVYKRMNIKIDSTLTLILRQIDVDLMSVYRKKHIMYRNIILEICVRLAIKIKC